MVVFSSETQRDPYLVEVLSIEHVHIVQVVAITRRVVHPSSGPGEVISVGGRIVENGRTPIKVGDRIRAGQLGALDSCKAEKT